MADTNKLKTGNADANPVWNLRELKDTRENVIEAIGESAFVPESAKAFLIDRIQTHFSTAKLLCVHVHAQIGSTAKGKKDVGHWDISEI